MNKQKETWIIAKSTDKLAKFLEKIYATEEEIRQYLFNKAMNEKEIGKLFAIRIS